MQSANTVAASGSSLQVPSQKYRRVIRCRTNRLMGLGGSAERNRFPANNGNIVSTKADEAWVMLSFEAGAGFIGLLMRVGSFLCYDSTGSKEACASNRLIQTFLNSHPRRRAARQV